MKEKQDSKKRFVHRTPNRVFQNLTKTQPNPCIKLFSGNLGIIIPDASQLISLNKIKNTLLLLANNQLFAIVPEF